MNLRKNFLSLFLIGDYRSIERLNALAKQPLIDGLKFNYSLFATHLHRVAAIPRGK
jgi:hypothetical protein